MPTSKKTTEPKKRSRVTKTEQTVELLRRIYGNRWIPRFNGSAHEGEKVDDAELVLHELAHQALLPKDYRFPIGRMMHSNRIIGDYIDELHRWQADLHEIYAIAVELNVARALRLRLRHYEIILNSQRNTELFRYREREDQYEKLIRRARKTFKAQRAADTVLALINGVREEGLEWGRKEKKLRSKVFII